LTTLWGFNSPSLGRPHFMLNGYTCLFLFLSFPDSPRRALVKYLFPSLIPARVWIFLARLACHCRFFFTEGYGAGVAALSQTSLAVGALLFLPYWAFRSLPFHTLDPSFLNFGLFPAKHSPSISTTFSTAGFRDL